MDPLSDAKVIDSWKTNAAAWSRAIRENTIASRNLVTNKAIVDAVTSRSPQTVLDIGCGEGWLVRALSEKGIEVLGVDAVPALIDRARAAGGGEFQVATYEAISEGALDVKVDVAVANFSLIGKESVDDLVHRVPSMLAPQGAFIVQTLNPIVANGSAPYENGWRPGSWTGFSPEFTDPAPWYFRTMGSWLQLFADSGFSAVDVREPSSPATGLPASVIFVAEFA